jgi:hypothetical protein
MRAQTARNEHPDEDRNNYRTSSRKLSDLYGMGTTAAQALANDREARRYALHVRCAQVRAAGLRRAGEQAGRP